MTYSSRQDFATEMAVSEAAWVRQAKLFGFKRTIVNHDQQRFERQLHRAMGYRRDQAEY